MGRDASSAGAPVLVYADISEYTAVCPLWSSAAVCVEAVGKYVGNGYNRSVVLCGHRDFTVCDGTRNDRNRRCDQQYDRYGGRVSDIRGGEVAVPQTYAYT